MSLRRVFMSLFALICFATSTYSQGQEVLPGHRYVFTPDVDFPGNDLTAQFDTTQEACERACSANGSCLAFTYNSRSSACFPKSSAVGVEPYVGAMSARKIPIAPTIRAAAKERVTALGVLSASDLSAAAKLAGENARRFPGGAYSVADVRLELTGALTRRSSNDARLWAGYLASQTDSSEAWVALSYASMQAKGNDNRKVRRRGIPAAVNAVLKAHDSVSETAALEQLADAFERTGRGKDMIPVLRRAYMLTQRDSTSVRLDEAIKKYGFRITDHQVDNNSEVPRVCAIFSEPLIARGMDYDSFVKLPDTQLVTRSDGAQLCMEGVEHGERYSATFRAGLPAKSGEKLARDVTIDFYVRDRSPDVRFPGRAYVLPRLGGAALPVETVNAAELELRLREVSDRNILRAIQDEYFGRPLSEWEDDNFAREIGAEIWTGTVTVGTEINKDVTTRIPLDEMLKGRAPGIYALNARIPGSDPYEAVGATQWFVLSDLGLTSMKGSDGLHVSVRGLADAKAKAGVTVLLISKANAVLSEQVTDEQGFVTFDAGMIRGNDASAPALIVADADDDLGFLPLTGPAFDLSDRGVEGRKAPGPIDVFLATDRGAYRAGETIGVTALVRDNTSRALPDLPIVAVLFRPDGAEYSRSTTEDRAEGGQVFQLPLGADVPRGPWRLDLRLGDDAKPLASRTVLVEDFLPERLDFTLDVPGGALRFGDSPPLHIQADYLFGAPAADLPVEAEMRVRPKRSLEDWPGFEFGPHDSSIRTRTAYLEPATTDASGAATVTLQFPDMRNARIPMQAEIIARVSEGSGRPVERRMARDVKPAGSLMGIKPLFEDIAQEGSDAGFKVVLLDENGAVQNGSVTWALNRIHTRYQWYQVYGNWNWETITRRTRVSTGQAAISTVPLDLSAKVDWGEYELVASLDGDADTYASVRFYAGWYGSGDGGDSPDRLDVGLDSSDYSVGETARLRINAPAGGTALISVLSTDVIDRKVVELDAGETIIPVEVTEDWGAGAYVTASVLRPVSADDPSPTRAMGLVHAKVAPGDKALNMSIAASDIVDGQEGTVDVSVQVGNLGDANGYVTLAAVDLGIQNLTAHKAPDPSDHYFGQRRLGVELRDLYGRLIDGQSGGLGQVRSGGDAGSSARMQSPPPTEQPMVFFSGLVPVSADGTVTIQVPKPAFNGTIRLDAVAWSNRAVGQASSEIIARDPVVVTASLPRFMAPGDQSRLLLELVHTEGPAGNVPLRVRAPGLQTGVIPASVTVQPGQKTVVELPVMALEPGDFEISVVADLPNGVTLTKTLMLGVRQNDPENSTTRRFSLAPGETFRFDGEVFGGLKRGTGGATLAAGPLARFDIPGLVHQLDRYPYGCTEQLTSVALPLLYISEFSTATDLPERVDAAIGRILTRQTASGSFGLWRAESGDTWLDAYVTDFLTRARDQGHDIPQIALKLAVENLRNRVNYAADFDKGGEGIAYALLVLSQEGAASIADLRYYADVKADSFATPRALAQLGAALANYGDTLRADAMFAKAVKNLGAGRGVRRWRIDYGSGISDAAAILRLAALSGSKAADAQILSARLGSGERLSTQEAAQVLLAADALTLAPGLTSLEVNGAPVTGPVIQRLSNTSDGTVYAVKNAGSNATDVTLTTFGIPEIAPEPNGYGYSLTREYFNLDGAPVDSGTVKTGDQLVVVLTINPYEETRARLMLEDPLPAGLEIDNPNLIYAGQIRALEWLKPTGTEHEEFLSDRFRAALTVKGTRPVRVAYKVRAVSPGSFHHSAAMVHDMYRPEYRAVTETGRWQVTK